MMKSIFTLLAILLLIGVKAQNVEKLVLITDTLLKDGGGIIHVGLSTSPEDHGVTCEVLGGYILDSGFEGNRVMPAILRKAIIGQTTGIYLRVRRSDNGRVYNLGGEVMISASAEYLDEFEANFLYIENKGKATCFFDESDPLSFVNVCKSYYENVVFSQNTRGIYGYDTRKERNLERITGGFGRPISTILIDLYGRRNSEILVNDDSKKTFNEWFDSIVNLNNPPEQSEVLSLDKQKLNQKWIEAGLGGSGFLYEDPVYKYASFEDIEAIIISNIDPELTRVYFVKEGMRIVQEKPYICAALDFPDEFKAGIGIKLSEQETKALWEASRARAFEKGKKTELRYSRDTTGYGLESYFAFENKRYSPFLQNKFSVGTQFMDTLRITESIYITDMYGQEHEEILVNDPSLTQSFNEWFDSLLNLNVPPAQSELMLFDSHQKSLLEMRWNKAGLSVSGILYREDPFLYWWEFPNPSAHALGLYSLELYLNDKETSSSCVFGENVFTLDIGNVRFPMTYGFGEVELPSVERFKERSKDLPWVELLFNDKAGKMFSDDKAGRKQISELVKTPEGFVKGKHSLSDVFSGD